MKCASALFTVLVAALLGGALPALALEPTSYVLFKGGLYSPGNSYDLSGFSTGGTTHIDSRSGFYGGGAIGVYILPFLAVEVEGGYLESKGSQSATPGATKVRAIPVVATCKVLLPLGHFEPFGEVGAGVYISRLDVENNTGTLTDTSNTTFGYHAGGGVNINFSQNFFVQLEGRYIWAEPSFGGQAVKLDGLLATGGLGLRF